MHSEERLPSSTLLHLVNDRIGLPIEPVRRVRSGKIGGRLTILPDSL